MHPYDPSSCGAAHPQNVPGGLMFKSTDKDAARAEERVQDRIPGAVRNRRRRRANQTVALAAPIPSAAKSLRDEAEELFRFSLEQAIDRKVPVALRVLLAEDRRRGRRSPTSGSVT